MNVISNTNTPITNCESRRDLRIVIGITIVATCFFSAASYPSLEGWVLWRYYSEFGIDWYIDNLRSQCDRPLHLLPSLIAWLIPGRYDISCMLLGGLLTVLRAGLSIAIAKSLNINRASGFLFFLACVLQPFWSASGYERFHAAQTSFVLFLAAFYLCATPTGPLSHRNITAGIIISLCGFMTYQGLFLVSLATPIIFMMLSSRSLAYKTALVFVPSCVIYFAFQKGITHYFNDPIDPSNNHRLTTNSIIRIYTTVSNSGIAAILSMFSTYIFLSIHSALKREPLKKQLLIAIIMILTPFSATIFHSSILKLNDPDRVMFPVMASILVVIIASCSSWEESNFNQKTIWLNRSCYVIIATSFFAFISEPLRFILLQNALLHQLSEHSDLLKNNPSVQLIDNTGVFGDVYTFLPPQISYATACYGIPGKFEICTPRSVTKIHNYAKRYPIKTTPTCEKIPASKYLLFLTIDYGNTDTLFGKPIIVHE
jgi:hypothetical protein